GHRPAGRQGAVRPRACGRLTNRANLYLPSIAKELPMKAAVFYGDHDIRIEDVAGPGKPGPGEVLLRPSWCGICGTDLHEYAMGPIVIPSKPHPLNQSRLPQILGHEFSAEVVEIGAGVTNIAVGQRVSVMPLLFCGQCYYCKRGLNHLCVSMACI